MRQYGEYHKRSGAEPAPSQTHPVQYQAHPGIRPSQQEYPFYPLLMDILKGYTGFGVYRPWPEIEKTMETYFHKVMLGEDPESTLLKGAQQVYVQAQRGGYNPGATGPKPN